MRKRVVFWMFLVTVLMIIISGCQKYDSVRTLEVKEAKVRGYFSNDPNSPIRYDQYKGEKPDPEKHRLVTYTVTVRNTEKKEEKFCCM
ncbi:hypothetical protein Adeg_1067 [Ammonifex degensii KC4]|uniref:Uncharacterized protein n=1 Tax=Ammonifex degensii (strain DSM 10501 / KC4) TaxID=429009 RepID=C9RD67_AMMDK|nr:hypothetical protein Adeg_1067 [Ammonifex degensii KC4]